VVNPIGSGDCFAAALAVALARGNDIAQAVGYGIAAASENCRQLLPARLDPDRVQLTAAKTHRPANDARGPSSRRGWLLSLLDRARVPTCGRGAGGQNENFYAPILPAGLVIFLRDPRLVRGVTGHPHAARLDPVLLQRVHDGDRAVSREIPVIGVFRLGA